MIIENIRNMLLVIYFLFFWKNFGRGYEDIKLV